MEGGAYKSLLWEHKKIHTSIMDMWPEAVTGKLAEPLHLTAAQPLAQQQQQKTQITLAAGKPLHVNTTRIYWLSCKSSRISPVAHSGCQSKSRLASKVAYCKSSVVVKMTPTDQDQDNIELKIINIDTRKITL